MRSLASSQSTAHNRLAVAVGTAAQVQWQGLAGTVQLAHASIQTLLTHGQGFCLIVLHKASYNKKVLVVIGSLPKWITSRVSETL